MIAVEQTVAVLLCAGFSERHPDGCKLTRDLKGRPLVAHAAETIRALPFRACVAVVPPPTVNPELSSILLHSGFDLVTNDRRAEGQDRSVQIGVRAAAAYRPAAVMILLGDMPYVEADHLVALATEAEPDRPSVSCAGETRLPPCLFPAAFLPLLLNGAARPRALMRDPSTCAVAAAPGRLVDFDCAADFANAASLSSPGG